MSGRRSQWDLPAQEFARRETLARLHRVLEELDRVAANAGSDEVHDVRVAIRRFSQAARIFQQLLPKGVRKIAKRLAALLETAATVRDLDVGLELAGTLGLSEEDALAVSMRKLRRSGCLKLLGEAYLLKSEGPEAAWPRRIDRSLD